MATFDPARTQLIEKVGTTQIWRGNIPLNASGEFAYDEISQALAFSAPTSFNDLSLIDNVQGSERPQWMVELEAYGVKASSVFPSGPNIPPQFNQPHWNPARVFGQQIKTPTSTGPGHLIWWQIEGGSTLDVLGPAQQSYNFIGLMEYMGTLRNLPDSILYFHCMNGTDRTGAVVAGYAMKWMGKSLEEAMALANNLPAAGTMSVPYQQLVKAYSEWLNLA